MHAKFLMQNINVGKCLPLEHNAFHKKKLTGEMETLGIKVMRRPDYDLKNSWETQGDLPRD